MEEQVALLSDAYPERAGAVPVGVLSHLPAADMLRLLRAVRDSAHVLGCALGQTGRAQQCVCEGC